MITTRDDVVETILDRWDDLADWLLKATSEETLAEALKSVGATDPEGLARKYESQFFNLEQEGTSLRTLAGYIADIVAMETA
jgi:hypothetical protein